MKRNFSKVVVLLLVLVLAIVPVFALAAFAEGETVTFDVPLNITAPTALDPDGTFPEAEAPDGYTFVGWTTEPIGEETTVAPATFGANDLYDSNNGTKFYAVYNRIVEGTNTYTRVVDASNLIAGNTIIIAAYKDDYEVALGQKNSSYRTAVEIDKNGDILDDIKTATIIKLENGSSEGTFSFMIESENAYLYCDANKSLGTNAEKTEYSSWSITIENTGEATIANSNNSARKLQYNAQNPRFACYESSQQSPAIYMLSSGSVEYYSTMTSYTATFFNNGSVYEVEKGCTKFPAAPTPSDSDYDFYGWATEQITEDTTDEPTIFTAGSALTLSADATYYAVYTRSEEVEGGTVDSYVLTDIANITETDVVVVTMTYTDGTVYALGNSNGTSIAPAATIITVSDNDISVEVADAIKWNIGGDSSGYIFYPNGTTNTWLYCTSTNNGTRVGTNANKTFVIDSASGYLKHTGTGRYVGVYRTNPDWRCYTNTTGNTAGQTLGFYVLKQVASDDTQTVHYYDSIITTETQVSTSFDTADVTLGSDLSINYNVIPATGTALTGYYMEFTFNGEVTRVNADTAKAGKYIFTFSGITPEKMGDNISAVLYDSTGESVITYATYIVKENLEYVKANYPEYETIVNATLVYGAAAQQYRGYNTENLVAEIPDDLAGHIEENVRDKTVSTVEGLKFTAAGVNFDYCNRIYARFENTNNAENVSVKVTIDGVECVFETFVNNGITTIYSDALKATQLGSAVVFQIYQGETLVQQLTYSAYDYVFGMKDTENTALKNLIFALYQYGLAAEACNN